MAVDLIRASPRGRTELVSLYWRLVSVVAGRSARVAEVHRLLVSCGAAPKGARLRKAMVLPGLVARAAGTACPCCGAREGRSDAAAR